MYCTLESNYGYILRFYVLRELLLVTILLKHDKKMYKHFYII